LIAAGTGERRTGLEEIGKARYPQTAGSAGNESARHFFDSMRRA